MIKHLEQLTMDQFIELLSGNTSVLGADTDTPISILDLTTRNIVIEYREIADPGGLKNYLNVIEEIMEAKTEEVLFSICNQLVAIRDIDNLKIILDEYGLDIEGMAEPRLAGEIEYRLELARSRLVRLEDEYKKDGEATDIRKDFDRITAALMAHFKFQIDTSKIRATIYANLIARYHSDIKAMKDALNKKSN